MPVAITNSDTPQASTAEMAIACMRCRFRSRSSLRSSERNRITS
jgi:hypothetical protein